MENRHCRLGIRWNSSGAFSWMGRGAAIRLGGARGWGLGGGRNDFSAKGEPAACQGAGRSRFRKTQTQGTQRACHTLTFPRDKTGLPCYTAGRVCDPSTHLHHRALPGTQHPSPHFQRQLPSPSPSFPAGFWMVALLLFHRVAPPVPKLRGRHCTQLKSPLE